VPESRNQAIGSTRLRIIDFDMILIRKNKKKKGNTRKGKEEQGKDRKSKE